MNYIVIGFIICCFFSVVKGFSQTWNPVGRGTNGIVRAMVIYNSELVIGGDFTTVTDGLGVTTTVNGIAAWNGSTWHGFANGVDKQGGNSIYALIVMGGNLYAGGEFLNLCGNAACSAGNTLVNRVSKWDGASWSGIGGVTKGVNSGVRSLGTDGTYLYIGGNNIGSTSDGTQIVLHSIVRWDPSASAWAKLGNGVNAAANIDAILSDGTNLYVAGQFANADGVANTENVAIWNGSVWSSTTGGSLNSGGPASFVWSLTKYKNEIYSMGNFKNGCGAGANLSAVSKNSAASWANTGCSAAGGFVNAAVVGSNLAVGGTFTQINSVAGFLRVASYDGTSFTALKSGSDLNNDVNALAIYNDGTLPGTQLFAGGAFTNVNASGFNYIAKWSPLFPLPVELFSFNASCNAGVVKCNWATASETNNDYFSVERSEDGKIFTEIGKVKGAENSSITRNYEFMDYELPLHTTAVFYYRLKQVDYDGKYEYFSPITVSCTPPDEWNLFFQNIISDEILKGTIIVAENEELIISILDLQGRTVKREILNAAQGSNFLKIDLANVEKGFYFVKVYNNYKSLLVKFVKL